MEMKFIPKWSMWVYKMITQLHQYPSCSWNRLGIKDVSVNLTLPQKIKVKYNHHTHFYSLLLSGIDKVCNK